MYGSPGAIPFGQYVRLYTLHQLEQPTGLILLRIRIETLRYSYAPLLAPPAVRDVDAAYRDDPRAGAEVVRAAVLPRLQTLLDTRDPFQELQLAAGQETLWRRYAAQRGLPAEPARVPTIHAPVAARLPARSRTSERLAQVQRTLDLLHSAAETASALAALWQNWQIAQGQRKLLDMQRGLLHDAIGSQLAGQDRALDRATSRDFVRGYLADHAGDAAYDAVFGPSPDG